MMLLLLVMLTSSTHPDTAVHGTPDEDLQAEGMADILFLEYRLLFRDLLGRTCVFSPSCSHYGQEAFHRFGPVLGTMASLERWTRCHRGSAGSPSYADGPGGRALDPLAPVEEVSCWGRSLLPF